MAWLTQGQIVKFVSLVVLLAIWAAGHFDALPPELQAYKQWIEFVAGAGGVVQAWLITPPQAAQPPRDEWTPEKRQLKAEQEELKQELKAEEEKKPLNPNDTAP